MFEKSEQGEILWQQVSIYIKNANDLLWNKNIILISSKYITNIRYPIDICFLLGWDVSGAGQLESFL